MMKHKLIKHYQTAPTVVDAIELTRDNMEAGAAWCGGEVKEDGKLYVPNLDGVFAVREGCILVRYCGDGRFGYWTKEAFERDFHEIVTRDEFGRR